MDSIITQADSSFSGPSRWTENAVAKGQKRVAIVKRLRAYRADNPGVPYEIISKATGISKAMISRLLVDYGHLSDDELTPEALMPKVAEGTKSPWQFLADQPDVIRFLRALYLQKCGASSPYMAKDRHTSSMALTLREFADYPELCPPTLARALRRGSQPKPLLRVLRGVTVDMELRHRGHNTFQLSGGLRQRREKFYYLPDGTKREFTPGDWWAFDDFSTNFPFWFLDPAGKPLIGRQGIYCHDVTGRWVGFELIGTEKDAYSAAIILRFLRRLFMDFGKPRCGIILEQSIWKARCIAGCRIVGKDDAVAVVQTEMERPEIAESESQKLEAGLRAIGIQIHYVPGPTGKAEIEGAFDFLQDVFPRFATEAGAPLRIQYGRHAGEYEAGAKAMRQIKSGSKHPRDLGILSIDEHRIVTKAAMMWINRDRACREEANTGVCPADIHDMKLPPLTPLNMAAFFPERRELIIRGGQVTATVDGQKMDFWAPIFAELGTGYKLAIAFDPTDGEAGCAIYNMETSPANTRGFSLGGFICLGQTRPAVARLDFRPKGARGTDVAGDQRRAHNRAVRTAYAAIGINAPNVSTARDGRGQVIEATEVRPGEFQVKGGPVREARALTQPDDPLQLAPPPARRGKLPAPHTPAQLALLERQAALARELMGE